MELEEAYYCFMCVILSHGDEVRTPSTILLRAYALTLNPFIKSNITDINIIFMFLLY